MKSGRERGVSGLAGVVVAVAVLGLASFGSVGCATRGRVSALEQRVTALETRVDSVSATAERAVTNSEKAQQAAERAADRADDAARTSEAIFKKHVSK